MILNIFEVLIDKQKFHQFIKLFFCTTVKTSMENIPLVDEDSSVNIYTLHGTMLYLLKLSDFVVNSPGLIPFYILKIALFTASTFDVKAFECLNILFQTVDSVLEASKPFSLVPCIQSFLFFKVLKLIFIHKTIPLLSDITGRTVLFIVIYLYYPRKLYIQFNFVHIYNLHCHIYISFQQCVLLNKLLNLASKR